MQVLAGRLCLQGRILPLFRDVAYRYNVAVQPERLVARGQEQWKALDALVERSQRGARPLSPDDVEELGRLYRAATSDLALAQRDFPAHAVTRYLNRLVGQAHAAVYRSEPLVGRRILHYARAGFPRAFRAAGVFIVAAALLLFGPAIVVGILAWLEPEAARWILPVDVQSLIPLIEDRELWVNIPVEERPMMSSLIATNNIQVSINAFAGGLLAGLLTIYILVFNGLMLGGIMGLTYHYGVGQELSNFVVAHGVIELSVIAFAGGAGLMIGWAMIQPGLYSRRDAVMLAARQALKIIIGCVPLLLIAGAIEGFISPNEHVPPVVKWVIGWGSGALMYLYLLLGGRKKAGKQGARAAPALSIPDSD